MRMNILSGRFDALHIERVYIGGAALASYQGDRSLSRSGQDLIGTGGDIGIGCHDTCNACESVPGELCT